LIIVLLYNRLEGLFISRFAQFITVGLLFESFIFKAFLSAIRIDGLSISALFK